MISSPHAGCRRAAGLLALAVPLGCAPELIDEPWRVSEARVLAISADPPEVRPGDPVALTALVVDPDGEILEAPQWSFCTRPRTGDERTAVTQGCLEGASLQATPAQAFVLPDACARFGPNPPPTQAGEPAQRPADPDHSGGYFLPVQAELGSVDARSFGAVRLRCDLPGVTRAIFDAYEERYIENLAPEVAAVEIDGSPVFSVRAGTEVVFSVELAAEAAEPFVVYDAAAGVLEERREAMVVRWFVSAGGLEAGQARVVPEASKPLRAQMLWRVPEQSGSVPAWVVVTDERGASAWASLWVDVVP